MKFRLILAACVMGCWCGEAPSLAQGAVVVVANRTTHDIQFTLTAPEGQAQPYTVAPGDLAAVPVAGAVELAFEELKVRRHYQLTPNAAYYFAALPEGTDFKEIGFASSPAAPQGAPAAPPSPAQTPPARKAPSKVVRILPVKILVDQKERAVQQLWEARLRARIETASQILEHHCHIKLEVVAAGEWESDDNLTDLSALLVDFERKVNPEPARLAIGFTSQRLSTVGHTKLGVTRAALRRHILMREGWPPNERPILEVLLHELGHYLGAAHSAESDSVMRASLGDFPKSRGLRYPGYDPVSTLIMNLMAEEVFDRGVNQLTDLSPGTRKRLREVYTELARTMPADPTPALYLRLLEQGSRVPSLFLPPDTLPRNQPAEGKRQKEK
jgi:hypothetical protein